VDERECSTTAAAAKAAAELRGGAWAGWAATAGLRLQQLPLSLGLRLFFLISQIALFSFILSFFFFFLSFFLHSTQSAFFLFLWGKKKMKLPLSSSPPLKFCF
jgi:hypothetical protein